MIKQKGYALLEVLLVLFVIFSLSLLTLTNFNDNNLDHLFLANELSRNHLYSIVNKEGRSLYYKGELISFNTSGNVNMARTIDFNNHSLIIHLGNGYFCLNEK